MHWGRGPDRTLSRGGRSSTGYSPRPVTAFRRLTRVAPATMGVGIRCIAAVQNSAARVYLDKKHLLESASVDTSIPCICAAIDCARRDSVKARPDTCNDQTEDEWRLPLFSHPPLAEVSLLQATRQRCSPFPRWAICQAWT